LPRLVSATWIIGEAEDGAADALGLALPAPAPAALHAPRTRISALARPMELRDIGRRMNRVSCSGGIA
jgi:hypothetical protein